MSLPSPCCSPSFSPPSNRRLNDKNVKHFLCWTRPSRVLRLIQQQPLVGRRLCAANQRTLLRWGKHRMTCLRFEKNPVSVHTCVLSWYPGERLMEPLLLACVAPFLKGHRVNVWTRWHTLNILQQSRSQFDDFFFPHNNLLNTTHTHTHPNWTLMNSHVNDTFQTDSHLLSVAVKLWLLQ